MPELNGPEQQAVRMVLMLLQSEQVVTPERIRERVAAVLPAVLLGQQDSTVDPEAIAREVETRCNVYVPVATALDDPRGHVEWLPERRGEIQWNFWNRYRQYLEDVEGLAPMAVQRLDEVTDQILRRMEAPDRAGSWDRRGMVVGDVQSGKTANYTGLICKAVDAGYPLVIVLAGLHNSLRSQTQVRLDEGFLGFDTQRRTEVDHGQAGLSAPENARMGVGRLLGFPLYVVHPLTSSAENGDFTAGMVHTGVLPGGRDPVILVVKKHVSILQRVIDWATRVLRERDPESGRLLVRDVPLLVIDDEADNASVNTRSVAMGPDGQPDPEEDPSRINGLIRRLLRSFDKSVYLGYTATPFANIYIHRDAFNEEYGEDLFPRSFIINLPAPSNYIGATRVFGLNEDPAAGLERTPGLPIVRSVRDYASWIPDNHRNGYAPGPLPESLQRAIRAFVLARAGRLARGQERKHNSMLVHVTRFTSVQQLVAGQIREELGSLRRRIRYGDGGAPDRIQDELRTQWENDFLPTTEAFEDGDLPELPWEDVQPHLVDAVEPIEVLEINGSARDVLEYRRHQNGFNVIAVGGDKLSRGLTLEGLSVSYYLRASRMYDTLMQMGRWFGYRPGYADLCRLYTTPTLIENYRNIAASNEELRREFDYMAQIGATPEHYGLRVRTHPDGLMVTAAAKMRHSELVELSFSATISETIVFSLDPVVIESNRDATAGLVQGLDAARRPDRPAENYVWQDATGEQVARYLEQYQTHPDSVRARSDLLAQYVRSRMAVGELTNWTVALISRTGGEANEIGGRTVGMIERAPHPPLQPGETLTDRYVIRRLVSPPDEALDLSDPEREEALAITQAAWQMDRGRSQRDEPPEVPSGTSIRSTRSPGRGLLLIYPLNPARAGRDGPPIVGIAVSFPKAEGAATIQYRVNNVYWAQEFAPV